MIHHNYINAKAAGLYLISIILNLNIFIASRMSRPAYHCRSTMPLQKSGDGSDQIFIVDEAKSSERTISVYFGFES